MTNRIASPLTAAAALTCAIAAATPGCRAPQPFGERNDIVVHADSALWAQIEPAVRAALEQQVFTTRPERIFDVTYVSPNDTIWEELRLFWQVLVIGAPSDELVSGLRNDSDDPAAHAPAIVHVADHWARGQLVSVMLLPEQGAAQAARDLIPRLQATLTEDYTEWVRERMYTSGVNDSLRQALAAHGFTLELPRVYEVTRADSSFRFRNPYSAGDIELLRSLLVAWRAGAAAPPPDSLLRWRQRTAESYQPAQDILEEGLRWDTVEVTGSPVLELRGVYQDRDEYPAAGPFITRAIPCPEQNRTYYMDAWLYAPGTAKYPYVRQLEILMDSFRCGGATTARGAVADAPAEG